MQERPTPDIARIMNDVNDATQQQVRYEHDDAKADDWGKASFPASDPPQNY